MKGRDDMAVKKKFPYKAAFVACNGGCRATSGEQGCKDGCIGCKACVSKCKFGAISLNEYGVAEVDECANWMVVKCSNKSKGQEAKKQCQVSCIGCGICQKTCTAEAIKVTDNCAVINEDLCLSCGMCVVKCPRHAIYDLRGIIN